MGDEEGGDICHVFAYIQDNKRFKLPLAISDVTHCDSIIIIFVITKGVIEQYLDPMYLRRQAKLRI